MKERCSVQRLERAPRKLSHNSVALLYWAKAVQKAHIASHHIPKRRNVKKKKKIWGKLLA